MLSFPRDDWRQIVRALAWKGGKRVDELLKLLVIAFGVCLGRWIAKKWDK
ncbi:hypothetical protein [Clostridium sp.]